METIEPRGQTMNSVSTGINIPAEATACLMLADGTPLWGMGFGAETTAAGEICFNTAMTGYQEILTDPSYAGQIVLFTFPHIGIVGATPEDNEAARPAALGMICRWHPTQHSNWRALQDLPAWMEANSLIGIGDIDTRAVTRAIRRSGALHAAVQYRSEGHFSDADLERLGSLARGFGGLAGMDLATEVTTAESFDWSGARWNWPGGYDRQSGIRHRVAVIDYGVKRNILRCLASTGCTSRVFPADASADDILEWEPDGVFLSNGPGDPAATGEYAIPVIRQLLACKDMPIFGICLGHQLLALALGASTCKMNHGHHGANHPVMDLETGRVEITSMNHGFMVDKETLPDGVVETHRSLFDGSNCGIRMTGRPVFSVQFHPEASPGPQDSYYLFERFTSLMEAATTPTGTGKPSQPGLTEQS